MRTGTPISINACKQYQRGLSRWENEGGSGPGSETKNPRGPTLNKSGLPHDAAGAVAGSRKTR